MSKPTMNRRGLLAAIAAVPAATASFAAVAAVPNVFPNFGSIIEHPDAALFLLDKEMDKATAAMKRALRDARRIDKKCDKLYPPEPAKWEEPRMPEDVRKVFGAMTMDDMTLNRPALYVAWNKEVREQRTAYDALRIAHRAKVDEIQRELGADAAEVAFEDSISAQYEVGRRILAEPANTVEGLLVKLRVADDLDLQHAAENDALISIAADIRAIAGGAP